MKLLILVLFLLFRAGLCGQRCYGKMCMTASNCERNCKEYCAYVCRDNLFNFCTKSSCEIPTDDNNPCTKLKNSNEAYICRCDGICYGPNDDCPNNCKYCYGQGMYAGV